MGRSAPAAQALVIVRAIQVRAESAAAPCFGLRPLAHLPGRLVPDMLGVAALELCDPLPFLVLVKADNALLHLEIIQR
jgi:hypothetical protein